MTAWHRSQGETGIPPIIDIRALANIAWLKRPASARSLKVHQLVALCSAALRPTRETWDKFIGNLKSLRQQGALSDEHTLALVASELVEPILSELEDDREPDAASIHEAIERVKAAYRDEGRATVQQALQLAESEAHLAQQTASAALARQASIDSHLADRAHRIGRVSANTAVAVVVILLLASIVIGFPGAFERIPSAFRFIAWGSIATAALFTAWGYWSGFSVRDLRHAIERAVSTRVLRYLRPPDTPLNGQGHR